MSVALMLELKGIFFEKFASANPSKISSGTSVSVLNEETYCLFLLMLGALPGDGYDAVTLLLGVLAGWSLVGLIASYLALLMFL